jgi:hypothetical protein
MKSIVTIFVAALLLQAAGPAQAWTYSDGDVLLIFRNGSQDIEFDIGSVSNFLGKTNRYTAAVTGWDPSLVTSTFGTLNSNLKVVLLATAGGTNWLTGAEPDTTAYNISSQAAETLHGVISAVGERPLYPLNIPTAESNAYSIDTSGQYAASSYDSIVSGGHFNGISKLGGNAPFTVEQGIPGFLDFWTIQSTAVYPGSPPDKLVGTFTFDASGDLTFVAGPRASNITAVSRSGNVSTVQFTTTIGNIYSLAYTSQFGGGATSWQVDPYSLVGNGKVNTLSDTNSSDTELYRIATQ